MSEPPLPDQPAPERGKAPPPRPAGWALGLPCLVLLCIVSIMRLGPAVERDIRRASLQSAGASPDSSLARHRARAEVDGRDVSIVADLGMADDLRSAVDAIARQPGVRRVRIVTAIPVELHPFGLLIARTAQGLALSGGVTSSDDRAALVDEAARLVGADGVDDRLALATGAPPAFQAAARFALALLGPLASGEVGVSGTVIDLRGRAPDAASYEATMALLRAPPPGYRIGVRDLVPPEAAPYLWSTERRGGEVVLGGYVPSEALRGEILDLASTLVPGATVRDRMQTAGGLSRRVDLLATAQAGLAGLASLQSGRVDLVERRVELRGETVQRLEAEPLAGRIRASFPPGLDVGPVEVAVVPASPFAFTALRGGGRVVLSGHLPDSAERRSVAALVAARFPGERLVDQLVVADGAPAGFPVAARVALETLGELAEGTVSIRDRDLRVDGRVLYGQLAARLRRLTPRSVPSDWTATVSLEPPQPEQAVDEILCGDLLADAMRRAPIRFPAEGTAALAGSPALETVVAIVRRCGRAEIRIVHEMASREPPERAGLVADERAKAIVGALEARNVTARLSSEGVVVVRPDAPGDRTTFRVGPSSP